MHSSILVFSFLFYQAKGFYYLKQTEVAADVNQLQQSGYAADKKLSCEDTGGTCKWGCSIYFKGYELCGNGMRCCADDVVVVPGAVGDSLDPICHSKGGRCLKRVKGCEGGRFWSHMCDNEPRRYCCILEKPIIIIPPIIIDQGCGKRKVPIQEQISSGPSPMVIGGDVAERGAWPFIFSLQLKTGVGGGVETRHICGGSIISQYWGVTAAHCVYSRPNPKFWIVRVGAFDIEALEPEQVDLKVEHILIHPDYGITMDGDVALVKFASPVRWSNNRQPACLPTEDEEKGNKECWVIGWGSDGKHSMVDQMKDAKGEIWNETKCDEVWGQAVTSNTICFGDGDTHGPCSGDSGGPLLCKEKGLFTLEGIVSWGTPTCTNKGIPAVFTRVRSYVDWILGFVIE